MDNLTDGSDIVSEMLDLFQRTIRTAVVVRVESFDASKGTAEVTPMVLEERKIEGERVQIPSATVGGCPVVFPSGGGRGLTFGLKKGDLCLALYRHRSHDEIDGNAQGPLMPQSDRRMNDSDLIVLPGFFPPSVSRDADSYRTDGQPVLSMGTTEALHIGESGANFYLVREDILKNYLDSFRLWIINHKHKDVTVGVGITGGIEPLTLGTLPVVPDIKSLRAKVDK